jgi:protein-disulfide isomerase
MSDDYTPRDLAVPVGPDDWSAGPDDAPVTLVEYGDFECPACGRMEPIVQELRRRAGSTLRFVYRQFPLTSSHPDAEIAAEASEAAGAQGAFWPMHDTLFAHQDALTPRDLVGYAADLGLDADRVASDLANHVYAPNVREDFMSGVRSGVSGTPTFFINGDRYDGDYSLEALTLAIQAAAPAGR